MPLLWYFMSLKQCLFLFQGWFHDVLQDSKSGKHWLGPHWMVGCMYVCVCVCVCVCVWPLNILLLESQSDGCFLNEIPSPDLGLASICFSWPLNLNKLFLIILTRFLGIYQFSVSRIQFNTTFEYRSRRRLKGFYTWHWIFAKMLWVNTLIFWKWIWEVGQRSNLGTHYNSSFNHYLLERIKHPKCYNYFWHLMWIHSSSIHFFSLLTAKLNDWINTLSLNCTLLEDCSLSGSCAGPLRTKLHWLS